MLDLLVKKNERIQVLRALAIIAVVAIHNLKYGIDYVYYRPFLNFCVPLFLFLSGYLTKQDIKDKVAFYKKRIVKVLIPYVIWTVINTFPSTSPYQYVYNLLTTRSAANMYFIFVYIQLALLTPVLLRIAHSEYKLLALAISPISLIVFRYVPIIMGYWPYPHMGLIWELGFEGLLFFYYLGLLIGNRLIVFDYSLKCLSIILALCISIEMLESYILFRLDDFNFGHIFKFSSYAVSTVVILLACKYLEIGGISRQNCLMSYIGDCSFGIYLSHIMVMRVIYHIPHLGNLPVVFKTMIVIIVCMFLIALCKKLCGSKICGYIGFC